MALALELKSDGIPEIRERIARMRVAMKDLRAPSKLIGEEMIVRTNRRMARGLDIHGRRFRRSRRSEMLGTPTLGGADRSLARSAHYSVEAGGLVWFTDHIGADVHQSGKTIRPKSAQWLTIPLRARGGNAFDSGLRLARENNRAGYRARDYKDTFFRRVRGKLFLFQQTSGRGEERGGIRALFLLVKSVRMPKNEWFGFTSSDEEMVTKVYGDHLDKLGAGK
jgi:hypothetical protein